MPSVTSPDETQIAFELRGAGPTVILVDGAMCSRKAGPMRSIAEVLAPRFTVIRYDRRGRNESSDTLPYSVEREIEDLETLAKTCAQPPLVFGISSGAVLIVKAAIRGVKFEKMALFEPALSLDPLAAQTTPDHSARLAQYLAANSPSDAVQYFLRQMVGVPAAIVMVMRWLPMWSQLKAIAKTLLYDAEITRPGSLTANEVASIATPSIVIWGGKTSPFLKDSSQQFAKALPNATSRELEGQSHNASGKVLAPVLDEFFLTST
jgi:pimeloyl-ACP methyl ester carboxylesterase